jgi:hypothetical protein
MRLAGAKLVFAQPSLAALLWCVSPLWWGGCSARLWVKTSSLKAGACGRSDPAAEQDTFQRQTPRSMINFVSLKPGARIRLVSDAMAEVVSNLRDGM